MENNELGRVYITMPMWMLEDLRVRAKSRHITVVELMRRAVSLERMLFEDPDVEVILRNKNTGQEQVLRVL